MRIMTKGGVWKNTEVRKLVLFQCQKRAMAAVVVADCFSFFSILSL